MLVLKKYRKSIVIYLISLIIFSILLIILPSIMGNSSSFKLFPNISDWVIYIITFIAWLVAPFIGILFGYFLAPFFLWIHMKIIGSKMIYYIEEKEKPEKHKFRYMQLFFPSLLALSFAMTLSNNEFVQNLMLNDDVIGQPIATMFLMSVFMGISLLFATTLVYPVYLLLYAGIGYTNKEKTKDTIKPSNLQCVGDWYLNFLKGYAGIGVLINLIMLITQMFDLSYGVSFITIYGIIAWTLMPFMLMLILLPVILIMDKTYESKVQYIRKWTKKFGITTPLGDILTFKD